MTEAELQAKRAQILAEIKRRGGKANAPGFAKQLEQVDGQLSEMRGNGGAAATKAPVTVDLEGSKAAEKAVNNDIAAGTAAATASLPFLNPNVNTIGGSQTTTFDPVTGMPTVDQKLTGANADIYNKGTDLTTVGMDLAKQQLGGYQPFQFDTSDEARQRIEQEVYNRLTRNFAQDEARDTEAAKQDLYNRGIPYSDDPNSRFQQEMRDITQRYDDAKLNASGQAVQMGNQAMQTNYGIGLGVHQQGMADIGALQNQGIGFQMPNLPGYQAPPPVMPTNPSEFDLAMKQIQNSMKIAKMNKPSGGGGGYTPAPPANPSPFET